MAEEGSGSGWAFDELSEEGVAKIEHLLKKKIEMLTGLQDEILIDLILSLVGDCNGDKDVLKNDEDLQAALGNQLDGVVTWLWMVIEKTAEGKLNKANAATGNRESPVKAEVKTAVVAPRSTGQPHSPVASVNTWLLFEKLLSLPFVVWASGAELDFSREKGKLRQMCMTGLARNSPFPPPPPSSAKYPPLLVLKQSCEWLRKFNFPAPSRAQNGEKSAEPVENLMITNETFRDYLMSNLHMMGFFLNTLIDQMDEADPSKNHDPEFADPLAEHGTELFMRLVKGFAPLLHKELSGDELYQKYKHRTAAKPADGAPAADDAAVRVVDTEAVQGFLGALAPPMSEIFGRSARARETIRKHEWLDSTELLRKEHPRMRMLYDLANIVDEEVLVIHPAEKKGYAVFVSGCCDNKLLGIALAASLIQSPKKESELLAGQRPLQPFIDMLSRKSDQSPATSDKYAHPWTFAIWTVVKSDGSLPLYPVFYNEGPMAGASHWIWPDGIPAQIPKWRGKRVLILSKAPFPNKFEPVRMFSQLDSIAEIKQVLTTAEVESTLKEIGASSDADREAAVAFHRRFQ